jgi:hypothetical protein
MRVSALAVILTALVGGVPLAASAQSVRVPGTKVALTPPPGFSPARQYPGFEQPASQASIMITELPGGAPEMLGALTPQALATRGMILLAAHDETINGSPARLMNLRQKADAADSLKWMLIGGNQTMTIMIVGTYPAASPASVGAAIQQALLSTTWTTAEPDPFEGLPFRITPTSRLKLAQRMSNMIMLTESGTIGSPDSMDSLYLAGHSIGQGRIADVRRFSERRAAQTTLAKAVDNFAGRGILVGGLDAYELEADATDARTGAPLRLYQVIVPDDTGYYILQGLSRSERAGELLGEYRSVTASFRLTTPAAKINQR